MSNDTVNASRMFFLSNLVVKVSLGVKRRTICVRVPGFGGYVVSECVCLCGGVYWAGGLYMCQMACSYSHHVSLV